MNGGVLTWAEETGTLRAMNPWRNSRQPEAWLRWANMRRAWHVMLIWLGCGAYAGDAAAAIDRAVVEEWLRQPVLPAQATQSEVQNVAEQRVMPIPSFATPAEWEHYVEETRGQILQEVVLRGEAAAWAKKRTRVEWQETIAGGPGYRIRKLRYEAAPGLWIPALLYEPERLEGKVPVVLNVNGHEGAGKAVAYKQLRCINQAKRGMLALNTEWLGMGQLSGTNYQHGRMNQLDLCGTSGLAPFYLALKRALDILLEHPNADRSRVAVAGLSGGGWQTLFISALDPRVSLANPVAGYSSFRTRARHLEDLGDSEQTPTDLGSVVDYTHLTAFLAPRPALLTYNAKDNCCFASGHALPPLLEAAQPIYRLYAKENHLRSHINHDPGDHNFGEDNRQALYRMLGDFFFPNQAGFSAREIPSTQELKSAQQLEVALPGNNATFHSLALELSRDLPRDAKLPRARTGAEKWQETKRQTLDEVVSARPYRATPHGGNTVSRGGMQSRPWQFKLRQDWTVPAVEIVPTQAKGTTLVIHDGGRTQATETVMALLSRGERVIALDLFYFGECRLASHDYLFALLLATFGERPLGLQASQLSAVTRWAAREFAPEPIAVCAVGPRSSLIALVSAALHRAHPARLDLYQAPASLRQVIEENWSVQQRPEMFCFGLLEQFDVRELTCLVAPREATFHQTSQQLRDRLKDLPEWYERLGHPHHPIAADAGK